MSQDADNKPAGTRRRRETSERLKARFGPLKPTTLNEEIYEAICGALRDGRLRPGEAISVRDLAAAVNTSPMPVREALRRLEAQGVLDEPTPGRAVSVPGMVRAQIDEIYTIRMELEGLAAERCARAAKEADVAAVEAAYAAMDRAFRDRDAAGFMETNHAFHMAIYAGAHMPRLLAMIEPLWLRISPHLWSLVEDRHLKFSMDQHEAALTALRARDGAGLRAAITQDIAEAKRKLEALAE